MTKELSPKQTLAVRCPICLAAPRQKCKLSTGLPRMTPHRERIWIAKDRPKHAGNPHPFIVFKRLCPHRNQSANLLAAAK